MPSRARVLIVDDDKAIADSLALIFSSHGYLLRVAYSAEQAAEIVAQWAPALAILDVVLPGMNGIDFAIQLKAICPACQVILCSGQLVTATLAEEAAKNGHSFMIAPKPVHPTFFLEEASRLLAAGLSMPSA